MGLRPHLYSRRSLEAISREAFSGKAQPYRTSGGKATAFRGAKHYRVLNYLVNSISAAMCPKLAHWMPSTIWRKVFSASVRRPL